MIVRLVKGRPSEGYEAYSATTWEGEAAGSGNQGHPWLYSEFEASLGYMRSLKNQNQPKTSHSGWFRPQSFWSPCLWVLCCARFDWGKNYLQYSGVWKGKQKTGESDPVDGNWHLTCNTMTWPQPFRIPLPLLNCVLFWKEIPEALNRGFLGEKAQSQVAAGFTSFHL